MRPMMLAATVLLLPSTLALADAGKNAPPKLSGEVVTIGADGHALHGLPWDEQARTQSFSFDFGIDAIPAPVFLLPAEDHEFYLAQDEVEGHGNGPKPLRFAVPIMANISEDDGEWIPVPGGMLWRLEISSVNAVNASLQFGGIDLPEGQQLRLSTPGMVDSTVGPIEGVGEFGNGTAWSLCMPSHRTLIEWFVPEGSKVRGLPFTSVDYYHGYRDIYAGSFENVGDGGIAGNCHNQPACYSAWSNESNATVRLIFSGFLCSGQLTATTAADETPYISTANHCIDTQGLANSCQFNFFYRGNTCGGGTSAGTTIAGSDLVATQLASDCTLLMIRPTLPTTVGWVGWLGSSAGVNTLSTCLHHPGGAPQAISFGVKNSSAFPCGNPQTNWSSVSWNNGITEPGSSGSAIYRDSDKRMYGVLTCGGSSCANTAADDGYGRWDVAVNSGGFATHLAAGSDDTLEPNDSCSAARSINPSTTYSNLVVKRVDEDWYSIALPNGSSMSVNMTFTHNNGDVDVELYGSCGGPVALARLANTNNEVFTYTNNTGFDTILMRVFLGSDTRNNYAMSYTVTTPPPPPPANDECTTATPVLAGTMPLDTIGATNSSPDVAPSCTDGAGTAINKDAWWLFLPQCTGNATITTCGTANFDTRIVVYTDIAFCPGLDTPVYACNDNGAGCANLTSTVTFPVTQNQVYYVRVGSKSNVGGTGTVTFLCEPVAPACPADLDNNGAVDGADLATMLGSWGVCGICPADIDGNGAVDGADLAALLGSWGTCQ